MLETFWRKTGCLLIPLLASGSCWSQMLDPQRVESLQQGGYVIVMRHASSPRQTPDADAARPGNENLERQLDEAGLRDAQAMGQALRELGIPLVEVATSPAFRAMETARALGVEEIDTYAELGSEDMRESPDSAANWLRSQAMDPVRDGNRLLITHTPNVRAAFPEHANGLEEGEALVFDPDGPGDPILVGRMKIGDWANL